MEPDGRGNQAKGEASDTCYEGAKEAGEKEDGQLQRDGVGHDESCRLTVLAMNSDGYPWHSSVASRDQR